MQLFDLFCQQKLNKFYFPLQKKVAYKKSVLQHFPNLLLIEKSGMRVRSWIQEKGNHCMQFILKLTFIEQVSSSAFKKLAHLHVFSDLTIKQALAEV